MKEFYIVHCIDSEGPLHETLEATFERINSIFQLQLKPSRELLIKLQKGQVDLGKITDSVQKTLNPKILNYNNTWDKIDLMVNNCMSSKFRSLYPDKYGNGWIYNWFCVDHVDYDINPRRRDIGYHNIFDQYKFYLKETNSLQDGLHFHYHPHPIKKQANLCATRWLGPTDKLFQVLSRRIIDRNWFPTVNRPGFQVNRPDSHWFLEQYIPFDYANFSLELSKEDIQQTDLYGGKLGDWRKAPLTWEPYHPSHDDYQVVGNCRRWIARCLNTGTRIYLLNEKEVERAFKETQDGKRIILSFCCHDFRDVRTSVKEAHKMLEKIGKKYSDIKYLYCEAVDAFRKSMNLKYVPPCKFTLNLNKTNKNTHTLKIRSNSPTFGPQPFLAIKTLSGEYFHDNLDFDIPFKEWSYSFDSDTLPINAIEKIGVAANNSYGIATVVVFDLQTNSKVINYYNK